MKIITLRAGEAIILSDDVRISVTRLDDGSGRAQFGIESPPDVPVVREELMTGHHVMPKDNDGDLRTCLRSCDTPGFHVAGRKT